MHIYATELPYTTDLLNQTSRMCAHIYVWLLLVRLRQYASYNPISNKMTHINLPAHAHVHVMPNYA